MSVKRWMSRDVMRMNKSFFLLFLILFLISCEQATVDLNQTTDETTASAGTACAPQWECAGENYKVQVLGNCTRINPTKCERGCVDGGCLAAEICSVGFKCIDENRKGYQKEDCSFVNKIDCGWGCAAGKCKEKPANATNTTTNTSTTTTTASSSGYSAIAENAEENETAPAGPLYTLQLGEEAQIEIDGTTHIINIYNLEVDRVMIEIDDVKSDWIAEGGSFTYANLATTVTVKSILFQSYGKKEIEYILS